MAKRRGAGEGSIYQRGDGQWVGALNLGYSGGKRQRKTVYARTRREAADKLRGIQNTAADGLPIPDERTTVEAWLRWWLRELPTGKLKPSTIDNYGFILERYVIPDLGHHRLTKLTPQHVQAVLRAMESRGLSASTRRLTRAVLHRSLAQAEQWSLVARNVAGLVETPTKGAPEIDPLTIEEIQRLIEAAAGDRLEALWIVTVTLGLRKGEALALKWDAIDFAEAQVRISGTLQRRPGEGLVVETPKTNAGRRTLPLPRTALDALRSHRTRQAAERLAVGPRWNETGFVFTSPIGTPLDPRNVTREFHEVCERAGLGRRRMHALRHSAATLMLSEGVPLEVISETLGHAGYAITADVYAKVVPKLQRRAADAMDLAIGRGVAG